MRYVFIAFLGLCLIACEENPQQEPSDTRSIEELRKEIETEFKEFIKHSKGGIYDFRHDKSTYYKNVLEALDILERNRAGKRSNP